MNKIKIGSIVVGVIIAIFLVWGASVILAPLFGSGNAYKKTESADYRISNYELFKDDCNNILAIEGKIVLAQNVLDSDTKSGVDSFTLRQSKLNLLALQNGRIELIAEYNANASKNKTRAKFKDAGLPDYINPNGEIGEVSCPSE